MRYNKHVAQSQPQYQNTPTYTYKKYATKLVEHMKNAHMYAHTSSKRRAPPHVARKLRLRFDSAWLALDSNRLSPIQLKSTGRDLTRLGSTGLDSAQLSNPFRSNDFQ